MADTKKLNEYLNESNILSEEDKALIIKILNKAVEIVKEPEQLEKTLLSLRERSPQASLTLAYSDICILIGELMELFPDIDWQDIAHMYMVKIREGLYSGRDISGTGLYGGLAGVGFGVYGLYKATSAYGKFIDSLNKLVAAQTADKLKHCYSRHGDAAPEDYDLIRGLSGIAAYLLLFREDSEIQNPSGIYLTIWYGLQRR